MWVCDSKARVRKRAAFVATCALAGATWAGAARAEGSAVIAESLFREGRALMDKGDYVKACPKLAESYAQDPATGTLLALALCQERGGKYASAWATYHDAADRAKREGRADRESAARERIKALEPRLSYLTIEVDGAIEALPGVVIKRDGVVVGKGAWGTATPIDGGDHVVDASADGKKPFQQTMAIQPQSDAKTVRVDKLEDAAASSAPAAAAASSAPAAAAVPAVTDEASATKSGMPPLQIAGLIVGGAGIVALGVSGFFGLRASSLNEDSKAGCNDQNFCTPDALAKRDDAIGAANVATVTLIAGGVLAATGVTLFIVGGKKKGHPDQVTISATPVVAWDRAGIVLSGSL
jgi:hypothetical protein